MWGAFMPLCTRGSHVWVHSCRHAHEEVMWRSHVGAFMPLCTRGGHV